MIKFVAYDYGKKYVMRNRLAYGKSDTLKYRSRKIRPTWPKSYKLNKITLSIIFGKLHYLAEHAPPAVQRKHKSAYKRFMMHHAPDNYFRYKWIEEYTAAGWL